MSLAYVYSALDSLVRLHAPIDAFLTLHQTIYGQAGELVELCALVTRHPYFGNSRYREDITGKHIAAAAAAEERGRARDLDATVAELLGEFEG